MSIIDYYNFLQLNMVTAEHVKLQEVLVINDK